MGAERRFVPERTRKRLDWLGEGDAGRRTTMCFATGDGVFTVIGVPSREQHPS
jgi:hypothetical protein